jgi:nucleoid-associated protein YgaU
MTITPETTYIAATIPAKLIYVSGTTLFQVAEQYLGDALYWTVLAEVNGLTDPWIRGIQQIYLPPVLPTGTPTGILGA